MFVIMHLCMDYFVIDSQANSPGHVRNQSNFSLNSVTVPQRTRNAKARIFLLADLREIFFRFRVGGTKKNIKKSSENDQSIIKKIKKEIFFFNFFFSISREQTVELVRCKTNSQLSVLTVSLYKKHRQNGKPCRS